MSGIVALEDCQFVAIAGDDGRFVGRVRQFHDLHTKAYRSRLDALDKIIDLTRDKIRDLHQADERNRAGMVS